MTTLRHAVSSLCLLLFVGTVTYAVPKDVPANHWAAPAVNHVVQSNLMGTVANGNFQGNKPVTRYELAVVLDRFVRYMEKGRQPLHSTSAKPVSLPASKHATAQVKNAVHYLTANGFIPANSSLVIKDGHGLVTAQELADIMSQVTIRLSDRALPTHTY